MLDLQHAARGGHSAFNFGDCSNFVFKPVAEWNGWRTSSRLCTVRYFSLPLLAGVSPLEESDSVPEEVKRCSADLFSWKYTSSDHLRLVTRMNDNCGNSDFSAHLKVLLPTTAALGSSSLFTRKYMSVKILRSLVRSMFTPPSNSFVQCNYFVCENFKRSLKGRGRSTRPFFIHFSVRLVAGVVVLLFQLSRHH